MLSSKSFTSPGDRGTKNKTRHLYYGPFTVLKVILGDDAKPVAYKLNLPKQWKIHSNFAIDKLKPFLESDVRRIPTRVRDPVPNTDFVLGEEEHVVEKIMAHRTIKKSGRGGGTRMQWLVRWAGCDSTEDDWLTEGKLNA